MTSKAKAEPGQLTLGKDVMGYEVYRPSPTVVGFADFHIGTRRWPIRDLMVDLLKAHVIYMARERAPDVYLFAGDAFHTRVPTAQDYADFGEMLSYMNAEVIMIPGNHDIISSRQATTLDVYDDYDNVTLVKEPKVIQRKTFQVMCVPWLPPKALSSFGLEAENNAGIIRTVVSLLKKQLKPEKFSILLAHCTALGTEYHEGASTVLGNDVLWTSDMFEGFDLCVLGHIHKPQQVKGTDNAYYVGSPCPVSFNEASQEKTLFLYNGAPDLIPIDAPQFVQLRASEITEDMNLRNAFVLIKKEHDEDDPAVPECIWHDIITIPPERDLRQRIDTEEALEMSTTELLDHWLMLEGEGNIAPEVVALATELMGETNGE